MAEVQAGRAALNFERIYGITVSAVEVARAVADHFRAQQFDSQVYRTSENRTVMQARNEPVAPAAGGYLRADRGHNFRRVS
jgi:hypothetical protein